MFTTFVVQFFNFTTTKNTFSKIHFQKHIIQWQKTLITLFYIYIINHYLNKYKIKYKIKKYIFYVFELFFFQIRTFLE